MRKRLTVRLAVLAASLVFCSSGWAYYYYIFYNTSTGPFNPIVQKFDVSGLVNNTVPFFISDTGPAVLATGDSFPAIINEIRGAAQVWNTVATSKIRLAYGGLYSAGASESSPGIDVEFSDNIPPGLVAMGAPQITTGMAYAGGSLVIPIVRAKIYLPNDFTQVPTYQQFPSYSEAFFVTLVHEFGHTLGLQHTLTSSVMSTLWTSAASKATPLGADDVAGISLLYPADKYLSTVGSISGRVTLGGNGVSLASVVALSPSNPAISTLSNPDGTYEIDGIPPGQYFIYAHPLPPALYGESSPDNIVYPTDVNGNSLKLNYTAFATQFYNGQDGGTQDTSHALPLTVAAGNIVPGINFDVQARPYEAVYAVRTYGFSATNVAEASPPITKGLATPAPVAAAGAGLLQANNAVTPGLNVQVLGTAAVASNLRPYPPPTPYIAVDVLVTLTAGPGPKHLLFYTPNDLYVLPAAFNVVFNPPPSITSVTPSFDTAGNRVVVIAGRGFFPDRSTYTTFLFDGLPGTVEGVTGGGLVVLPPPGPSRYPATVEALNSDGQSSLFLQPTPPIFTYDATGTPSLVVTPKALAAGKDIVVDVFGSNTHFIDGQTTVGFGTSDVTIDKITVVSPTHLSITVTPKVGLSTAEINVTTGLGVISQALGYKVTLANPKH